MSAIIVRSAAAGKPVLSSDFGLMGQLVRTWRLGRTIDSTNPAAIAQALTQIAEDGGAVPFDAESAARFAELNTAESFGATLFDPLLRFGEKET
jgi:glycosyltransferase involved in cell wall biosynthesis